MDSEPHGQTLFESDNNSNYSGKFGEDFGHHMVSAAHEKWWNWAFRNRYQKDNEDSRDTEFKNISDSVALKNKCLDAYGKTTSTDMRDQSKDSYEKSVWRYCSLEGGIPLTFKDKEVTENKIFWEIQERAFFKNGNKPGIGQKATKEGSVFKKLYEGKPDENIKTLKDACTKSWSQLINEESEAALFCSIDPSRKNEVLQKR